MKLLTLLLPILAAAIPLSISGRPATQPRPHQKALSLPQPAKLSPANSFSTTSDIESNSDSSTSSKSSTLSKINSLFSLPKTTTGDFKCHHYPRTAILPDLSTYITTLLRSYRESIFGSGSGRGDQERMMFETCYAGYEAGDVNPSIYFGDLAKKQSVAVEKLLRNQVLTRFPTVEVVRERNALAIVVREGGGLRRRNTV